MMPIAGRLTERYGGGRIAIVGVSLLALSTIPLAFIDENTSFVTISAVLFVRGISIGLGFMPAMTAAFAAMRPDQLSDATPQINVVMRLGSAVGVGDPGRRAAARLGRRPHAPPSSRTRSRTPTGGRSGSRCSR